MCTVVDVGFPVTPRHASRAFFLCTVRTSLERAYEYEASHPFFLMRSAPEVPSGSFGKPSGKPGEFPFNFSGVVFLSC